MWNARLDESQSGIKIAGRNISNLRYADDTTLMAENKEDLRASWWRSKESEEGLKSLLMKVKEENEHSGLKLNILETKIMASGSIISWQIDREKAEQWQIFFSGLQNHCW